MTDATLTLKDMPPLTGTVETGGDYVRFRTQADLDQSTLGDPLEGVVEMDGHREEVVLESAHPYRPTPGLEDGPEGVELTLRRRKPSA
ncbi:hypothetical protein E4191_09775 [Paracoccus liaowanqingii]|uniref:Uncharacterized protein n=1 Tax=Paracoccus liaowanqingii TaxID=2560053 RepID=A0A4P7HLD3_9RHOB|nr:hypothetical protein [Paracoccus liaowanqingii]QBX34965.1 hypothetical protein E4191_09775 [Paracoccus liaowanqingii]